MEQKSVELTFLIELAKPVPPKREPTQVKIELKKTFSPSEKKKHATAQPNDRQKSVVMSTPLARKHFNYSVLRRPASNTGKNAIIIQTGSGQMTTPIKRIIMSHATIVNSIAFFITSFLIFF
jgi:hypothetical protein